MLREEYQADLDDVSATLVAMVAHARSAMSRATRCLLDTDADPAQAQAVVDADGEIDALHRRLEEKVYGLFARKAPVASDLRLLFTALLIGADAERMGNLAKHVAETALRRYPFPAVSGHLAPVIAAVGAVADRLAEKIGRVLVAPDAPSAASLELDDDEMDRLQEQLFAVVLGDTWSDGVEAAVDGALLGRFFERFADHAVNAGRRMVFLVTGEFETDETGEAA